MQGGTRPRAALVWTLLGVGGLGLLVWASAGGPVAFVAPSGDRFSRPILTPSASATTNPTAQQRPREGSPGVRLDLHWIGDLILAAVLVLAVLLVLWLILVLWRRRPRRLPTALDVGFDEVPEGVRLSRALVRDRAAQEDALAGGSARNGIVACWQRLEETIAGRGLARREWETSSEYAVRVLHSLDLDPRAIGELAALYREARFSEHEIGEEMRTAARDGLDRLHRELALLSGPGRVST